jgi:molecular chaperone HscA
VLATRSALAADGDLLSETELAAIDTLVDAVLASASGDDPTAIDSAIEALAKGTEPFAAQRMNRGIRAALAGRKIGDF